MKHAARMRARALAAQGCAVALSIVLCAGLVPAMAFAVADEDDGALAPAPETVTEGEPAEAETSLDLAASEQAAAVLGDAQQGSDSHSDGDGDGDGDADADGDAGGNASASGASANSVGADGADRPESQNASAAGSANDAAGADDPKAAAQQDEIVVSVKITGVTPHEADEPFSADTWIPLIEVPVSSDKDVTAWDVFTRVLDEAEYTYKAEGYYYPFSITTPDGYELAATTSEPWSYWSFLVNDEYASVGADEYVVKDGDVLELVYVDGSGVAQPEGEVTTNPSTEHPDLGAQWNGYAGGSAGSVVNDAATVTEDASLQWKHSLLTDGERAAGASCAYSDPLVIGGKIYVVSGSSTYDAANNWAETKSLARLSVVDPATGKTEREVTLARGLDSQCRIVYADGVLVVPLTGGYVQALSASTLETMWVVDAIDGAQNISSLTVSDGYVYVATADSFNVDYTAAAGTVRRINLYTGALAGAVANSEAGYYWAGGIASNGCYVVGDDAGWVVAFSSDLSREVSRVKLSASVRSTIVAYDGFLYATTSDGVLHKLALSAAGALSEVASVGFAASSTSTPTIAGGLAFVGGSTASYGGVLAVVDVDSMTVKHLVDSYVNADGATVPLPGDVKSAPLVSVQNGGAWAYFTCNSLPGGLYAYKAGSAAASLLHVPDGQDQNYSMSSAFAGPNGVLYYINDSGNLFALAAAAGQTGGSGAGTVPGGAPVGATPASGAVQQGGARVAPVLLAAGSAQGDAPASADAGAATARAGVSDAGGVSAAAAPVAQQGGAPWLAVAGLTLGVCLLAGVGCTGVLLARRARKGVR